MVNKESCSKPKNNFSHYIGIYTACLAKGTFFTLIMNFQEMSQEKELKKLKKLIKGAIFLDINELKKLNLILLDSPYVVEI